MAFFFGFHLFGANFASDEEAELYACAQWEPVPPTTTSDAEYCAWEDRNRHGVWLMSLSSTLTLTLWSSQVGSKT